MTAVPTRATNDPSDEAGFTLVEVLVALALFSLLVTVLFSSVRFGVRAWHNGSAHADRVEHSLSAQNLLRRIIRDAYPLYLSNSAGRPQIDFDGARESISFLGNAPIVLGGGGRFRFKVAVERNQSGSDLVLTSISELANGQEQSAPTKTVLLVDIERVELAYFGPAASNLAAQWHETWVHRNELPSLIRIRVALRSGDVGMWPDLLVAPRVSADVSCVYDSITKRCRGR